MREKIQSYWTYGDHLSALLYLAMLALAAVMVRSATVGMRFDPNRQILVEVVALAAFAFALLLPYEIWIEYSYVLYALCLLCLILVLIPGVGKTVAGSRSWLVLGPLGFQPSEVAKVAAALAGAGYVKDLSGREIGLKELCVLFGIFALPMALTAFQPDFGTATAFLPLFAAAFFLSSLPLSKILKWTAIALVGVFVLFVIGWFTYFKPYQKERVLTFLDPSLDPRGAGYQVNQARIAVGSGEVAGKGLFSGTQNRLNFLPAPHTDFIFGVVSEELGFVGSVSVLAAFLVLLWRMVGTVGTARNPEGKFLVTCAFAVLTYHVIVNVGMVIGLLPTTGIPLPFLSYGGSFLICASLLLALALNVHSRRFVV
jgi:rod shape determining protein RodA